MVYPKFQTNVFHIGNPPSIVKLNPADGSLLLAKRIPSTYLKNVNNELMFTEDYANLCNQFTSLFVLISISNWLSI